MLSQPEQVIVSEDMAKLSENGESQLNGSSSAQGELRM